MESGGSMNNGSPARLGPPSSAKNVTPTVIDLTFWNSSCPNFCPTNWRTDSQLTSDHCTILIDLEILADRPSHTYPPQPNPKTFILNKKKPLTIMNAPSYQEATTLLTSQYPTLTLTDDTLPTTPQVIEDLADAITKTIQTAALTCGHLKRYYPKSTPARSRVYNWTPEVITAKRTFIKAQSALRRGWGSVRDRALTS
jgi:hypothetical protein